MRPRILIIHHSGLVGGAGRSLIDLWGHLEASYEVSVYVPDSPNDLREMLHSYGYYPKAFSGRLGKIPYYSGGEGLLSIRFWYYAFLTILQRRRWAQIIRIERPDVVIVNSGVLVWLVRAMGDAVKVCYVRETTKGRSQSLINRYLARLRSKFDVVCYLTEFDRDRDPIESVKILVPDAVDPADFKSTFARSEACDKLNVRSDTMNVLYLGGHNQLKGYDTLVRCGRLLGGSAVQILAAGYPAPNPKGLRKILRLMSGNGITADVRLIAKDLERTGMLCPIGLLSDVNIAYAACDVVVFPMRHAHQARPAFEAGFHHKPIIISDFPNVHDCVEHGRNGLLVKPGDPEDLARAVLSLVGDASARERMGYANRDHSLSSHSSHKMFVEFEGFVQTRIRTRGKVQSGEKAVTRSNDTERSK